MRLSSGDRLGRYTVLAPLGRGGMGEVYQARDSQLGRDVAIKLLSPTLSEPGEYRQRFEREARVVARLNHPNILTLHDVGEERGALFIVTELLEGATLRGRLQQEPLPWSVAVEWAVGLAEGLAAAHDLAVIHRDLKPENIWITRDERIKILDFGIAKVIERPLADHETFASAEAGLTGSQMLGTVGYMSPEQVRCLEVDARSDIFSLGAVLYEMVCGQRPFARGTAIDELHAILNEEPTPLPVSTGCPPGLRSLIARCLAKAPRMRFTSARDLAFALHALREAPAGHTTDRAAEGAPAMQPIAGRPIADPLEQSIAYCTTRDGVRIAYATTGRGPLLVRVLGWFTHLEMEWAWPDLRALWEQLGVSRTVVRYDGRGIGLSDRWTGEFTEETRELDLEAVLDAVGADATAPAALLGISEGGWTAAALAIRLPERVTQLVVYGGYARGAASRAGYDVEEDRALQTLMRKGWGRATPAFRQVFTSQFYREDADPELLAHFNELQRASADPDTAARYLRRATVEEMAPHFSRECAHRRLSFTVERIGRSTSKKVVPRVGGAGRTISAAAGQCALLSSRTLWHERTDVGGTHRRDCRLPCRRSTSIALGVSARAIERAEISATLPSRSSGARPSPRHQPAAASRRRRCRP